MHMQTLEAMLTALAKRPGHGAAGVEFFFGGDVVSYSVTTEEGKRWRCCFKRPELSGQTYGSIFRLILDNLQEEIDV